MRWSIRYQLLVPLLTLLLGVVGISTWTALASANRARQQIETQVRDIARVLSEAYYRLTDPVLKTTRGLSGAHYLVVHGVERYSSLETEALEAAAAEPVGADADQVRESRLAELQRRLEAVASPEDPQTLRLGAPVTVHGTPFFCSRVEVKHGRNAGATLYILYPEALWRDALWEAIRPSLVLGIFGGLASVVLAVGVAQRLSRRIQELERRTRLIAAGDFSPMPLPGRNDELRDLGRSVNEMAQRLAQLQETVKNTERLRLLGQVSGGLAHQLRNGVTGARLAVQLHAQECNGQADAETLDVALRQLALMEANLKRFLDLGRTEISRPEPCALIELIDEAVRLLRPQCRHAHIALHWQPPQGEGGPIVQGDAGQLGHLFLNIIGNAVEAAGPDGWVRVDLQRTAGRSAIIEVSDSGPGPPPEVAERLFEPFVTSKREGVGLGLAVARRSAEAHGGRIDWRREADRTCFRIELPLGEC